MSPGRSETNTNSQVLLCPPLTPVHPPDTCSPCLPCTGPGPGKPQCSPDRPGTSEDPSNIHPAFQVSRRGSPGSLTPASSGHCTLSPVRIQQLCPPWSVTKVSPKPMAVTGASLGSPPAQSYAAAPCRPGSILSPEKQDLHFIRPMQAGILPIQTSAGHCPPLVGHPHFRSLQHTGATYACPPKHVESQTRPESATQTRRGGLASHTRSVHSFPVSAIHHSTQGRVPARGGVCANKDHHHRPAAYNHPEHRARSRHSGHDP